VEVVESLEAFTAGSLLDSELPELESVDADAVSLLSKEVLDFLSDVSLEPFSAGRLGRP
jgi:hypothetical protein